MAGVRIASDRIAAASDAFGRAVPNLVRNGPVQLLEHRVIHVRSERILDRVQIGAVAVGVDLHAPGETARQVLAEFRGRSRVPRRYEPRRDNLRIGTERRPRPNVPASIVAALTLRAVLLLHADEAPNLVQLEPLAWQVP